ncbi:hypothetical protein J2Y58_003909 [Sphingomonas sp. BE138]|uniref:hypothetical protein n=1 Tax=Sphingomonas sp. BE138 TaxID=2817845 RepID=UPI00285635EF|nr:hypothetical protein [Sphingomonas sp. BE138]MDR6790526.1 hypothetical protein [Sphingomonas sp. BE138]
MSRNHRTSPPPLPPLAHDGRLAQLAAERFPVAQAPMSQSDRAAYWLGEYVNARRELPHLKPSDLLALMSCPLLSGPWTMTVWIEEGTTNACQEAQARRDHRQAA